MVNKQLSMSNREENIPPMTRGERRLVYSMAACLIGLWATFFWIVLVD